MDTYQINGLLKRHMTTRDKFVGTFAFDEIPHIISSDTRFVIVNQDPSTMNGSHWVALEVTRGIPNTSHSGTYFDSYGQQPPAFMDKAVVQTIGPQYIFNKKPLQAQFSTTCGQWCMAFIHQRCLGTCLQDFLDKFDSKDLWENDEKVNRYVERTFRTDLDVVDENFLRSQIGTTCRQSCRPRCLNMACKTACTPVQCAVLKKCS